MNSKTRKIEPYLFISLGVLIIALIILFPLLNIIRYSFADASLAKGISKYVGLDNYKYLISKEFLQSLKITIIWFVGSMLGMSIFGLIIALALNKPLPGRAILRGLVIIPWIVPHAFAGIMWKWVVHSHYGIVNNILMATNLINKPIDFLSVSTALPVVIIARIWQGTPFMILGLLAALATVPKDIEEAARLDGATGFKYFRYITFPIIKPFFIVYGIIVGAWTLQVFDMVYIMTAGGPAQSTEILSIQLYKKTFVEHDLGVAGVITTFLVLLVALLALPRIMKKEESDV